MTKVRTRGKSKTKSLRLAQNHVKMSLLKKEILPGIWAGGTIQKILKGNSG